MKIIWLGHASFLIETESTRIVTDPYDKATGYRIPDVSADLVTISHSHYDHNCVEWVLGNPQMVSSPGKTQFRDVDILGIPSFHDQNQGRLRGDNTIFVIKAEDLVICHLGDLGHLLSPDQLEAIGKVDVLLAPVGGTYTITAGDAVKLVDAMKPRVTVPMHFKTPPCKINLTPVEDFTKHYDRVAKLPYLDLSRREMASLPEVVVLDYSYI
ncbi:MAG: MBL fold metallo-hydrolase [Bacillota bacterium]